MEQDSLDFLFEAAYRSPHATLINHSQSSKSTSSRNRLTPFRDKNQLQKQTDTSSTINSSSEKRNHKKKKHQEKKKSVRIHSTHPRSSPEEIAFQLSGNQSSTPAAGRSYKQFTESLEKFTESDTKSSDISSIKRNNLKEALEYSKQLSEKESTTIKAPTNLPTNGITNSSPVGPVSFSYMTIGFNNNLSNLPEWTCLRDNYIRQLHSLESHESIASQKGYKTEISIPNFISLLLSLRKISCRIAYAFQVAVQSKNIRDTSFSDLHGYILQMVNDLSCINRSPFVDWLGIMTIFNPFLSCRRLDKSSALLVFERKPPIGVQIHRLRYRGFEETDERNAGMSAAAADGDDGDGDADNGQMKISLTVESHELREELRMTESEQEFVDSLSETVWTTFLQHQEATKYRRHGQDSHHHSSSSTPSPSHPHRHDQRNQTEVGCDDFEEGRGQELTSYEQAADLGYQNLLLNSQQLNTHLRIKNQFWRIWRRRYLIRVGLRNIREGRERCVLRKLMDAWVHFVWQNIQFRKMQKRRWMELLTMTFQGWLQYLFWCRRFNLVLQRAIRENQRRVLLRMHLFAKQEHQNRSFQRMRALMPLRITFRALKHNALINRFRVKQKLIRGTQHVFSDLQLRQYCFKRWREYVQMGMALETIDVALLVAQLRNVFRNWKIQTWPERYGKETATSRLFRTVTNGFITSFQDNSNKSFRALSGGHPDRDNNSENGDIKSQFSFDSKTSSNQLGWLAFALRNG